MWRFLGASDLSLFLFKSSERFGGSVLNLQILIMGGRLKRRLDSLSAYADSTQCRGSIFTLKNVAVVQTPDQCWYGGP